MTEDPFGRSGEERTDAFGRPVEPRPPDDEAPQPFLPPTDPAREQAPGAFLPPTESAPEQTWWAGAGAGAIRAHGSGTVAGAERAEWPQRAAATAVDFLIRAVLIISISFVGAFVGYLVSERTGDVTGVIGVILGVLAAWAYAPWMLATRNGQTVGHRVSGTRVVKNDGTPIEGGGAFLREVLVKGILIDTIGVWLTLLILPLLNYLWPLWDDRNEALHDKMCDTLVVKV